MPVHPPAVTSPPSDHTDRTLRTIGLVTALAATFLTPLVYLTTSNRLDAAVAALVAAIGWLTFWMVNRGYKRFVVHFLVYGVMTASSLEVLAFGSVRAAGVFMALASVVGAGIFLGLKPLIGVVSYGVVSLGLLTLAEHKGLLTTPDHAVGIKVWMTHSVVLVVVAIMVFYSRSMNQRALDQLHEELQRRIRSEQERDRSLQRFRRIFHSNPSPMIAQSASTGIILDVNPAFERCYGHSKDSILGRTDAMLWADASEREAYIRRLTSEQAVHQVEAVGLRADGSWFRGLVSSETGRDEHDQLVITSVTDLTAHTEALERLRRSEERFAKAFNFSPMNLSITRLSDGQILEVNRGSVITEGLSANALQGKTTVETGAWLTPAHRQAYVNQLKRDGRVLAYESQMLGRDGKPVDVRLWGVLIDIDGEECILSSTVNVSEEKRREALLLSVARGVTGETGEAFFSALTRHAAQTIKADIVLIGELRADRRIHTLSVWVDGQPAPNFDYDPNGMPCQGTLAQHELFVQERGLMAAFPDAELLAALKAEAYVGQCLFDQDGTPAGVLAALWRQPISVGAETRALMSIFASRAAAELIRMHREREIQRLNATLEDRVKRRTAELEKLNAELDSFAYSVSHDLKSPLRSIDGFTQLLGEQLQGRLSADEQQLFERVLQSTQRMSALIADMLALARVSQGQMHLMPTDLSEIGEQVMQAERAKHPEQALQWRVERGLVAVCDPRLARIALENLLGNAVKYTRDQPQPLIEMGRHRLPGASPGLFFVRDNGVGFDMAHADKLFKPFQRLHMPSSGFEGTGIGLATVRRIVERHGGHIEGRAEPGAGAEFRFSFGHAGLPQ